MAMRTSKNTSKNEALFASAKEHLVGGVDSPVRSFKYTGGTPLVIDKGQGALVYDHDGKAYIDYVLSFGAIILGHAHPEVTEATKEALDKGGSFGATTASEIELASLIKKAIPFIGKIRFVNSGTEAVMSAVRLARGVTGKNKIIKFTNSYHGHADQFLAEGGSGLSTLNIPLSKGVPEDFIKHTIVVDYGDPEAVEMAFKKHTGDIAAVITEPAGGNYGVIPPDKEFLKYIRKITKKHNTLLIFDEVITGFRFSFGSISEKIGIQPDIIVLGKIIGGGLPIGAYAASKEIMDKLAPLGDVYQASTFGGNPVVMQSGLTALKTIFSQREKYGELDRMTKKLKSALTREAEKKGISIEINSLGSMFSIKFRDKESFKAFYAQMLEEGIYLAPSEYEANFLSFAHTDSDVESTIKSAKKAFKGLGK